MSIGIDVVIGIVKGILSWIDSNKKCQEKIEGVITYIKAINHALTSFKPKGKPSSAIEEILTVTYQCMRDIKALLDQVKQGETKWLFSPDSYYAKLTKKESQLAAIIPVLSLSFNIDLYQKSEDIQAMLSPQAGATQQPTVIPVNVMYYQPVATAMEVQYVPKTPTTASGGNSNAGSGGAAATATTTTPKIATAPTSNDSKSAPALPPPIKVSNKPLAETLLTGDGRDFWKANFNHSLTVTTTTLTVKVESKFGAFDAKSKAAFQMAVDHNKDEVITIYEFAKFATPTLAEAIAAIKTIPDSKKADAKTPCNVLWCDPNLTDPANKKLIADALKKGSVVMQVPSAKDGIEYLKVNSDLMFVDTFRVMSSNAIYTDADKKLSMQEVLDAKMSAAEDIIRYLRQKRSFTPVLVYCNFTFPQAEKVSKNYTITKATKDAMEATAYASGAEQPWIAEAMKNA